VTDRHLTWREDLPAEGLEAWEGGLLVLRRILERTYVRLDGDPAEAPALRRMVATLTPTPPHRDDGR
jgi:hypothetical protein